MKLIDAEEMAKHVEKMIEKNGGEEMEREINGMRYVLKYAMEIAPEYALQQVWDSDYEGEF